MKDQKRWSFDVTYASCASLYVCPSVYVVTKNEWQFVSFYLHFSVFDFSCLLLYLLFPLLLKINYILILEDSENHFRNRDFRFFLLIASLKTRFYSIRSFIFHGQLNIYTYLLINAIYGKIFLIFCGRSKVVDYFHGTAIAHSDTISCGYMLIALHSCTLNCTLDKWLIKLGPL